MIKNLDSFRIVPDHSQKKIFRTQFISATSPPRRQNVRTGTILRVKKYFPERSIVNIAEFFSEYCATTFILTTNSGIFGFLISHFTKTYEFSFEKTDFDRG
jgi:predicted nucleotidyltransferase